MRIEKPNRKKQTAAIRLDYAGEEVFGLMCPVREHDWVPGWETTSIHSESGLVEQDCIFTTLAGGKEATWITTAHDLRTRRLTMYKLTPGELVTRLDIAVDDAGSGCTATINYEHTSLSNVGAEIVAQHTPERHRETIEGWKELIHRHLSRGGKS